MIIIVGASSKDDELGECKKILGRESALLSH